MRCALTLELFCADTQPQELHALRTLAQEWMQRLEDFRPPPDRRGVAGHGHALIRYLSAIVLRLTPKPLKLPCWIGKCALRSARCPALKGRWLMP